MTNDLQQSADAYPESLRVLVSYSRRDIVHVGREAIEKGQEWWMRIKRLNTDANTVVFVLSPDSAASSSCQAATGFDEGLERRIVPIVASELGNKRPPAPLSARSTICVVAACLSMAVVVRIRKARAVSTSALRQPRIAAKLWLRCRVCP
jgi:hypothetical protein